MTRLVVPIRLRSIAAADEPRKVTWLELFFDLVFVAAVAQVAAPLRHEYSVVGVIRFAPLFGLIWWAWTGHTVFATRFDSDDIVQRMLTLVQMFIVAAMAANAKDALDSRSSAGFAAAYAAMRFVLVAQYVRARDVPDARPLTMRYAIGHGVAAVLWLGSAVTAVPARFVIWALAFVIDLGTPWLAVRHSVKVPPDAAHLPERFGLFTLILLGEWVVAVMQGMESQDDWTVSAAACAFLGMAISFLIWWWYFDGGPGASEQPVRTRSEARRFHVWSYAHFPLYLAIVAVGVGVQRAVTAASHSAIAPAESAILLGGTAVLMLAMITLAATSAARREVAPSLVAHLAIVAGALVVARFMAFSSPVLLVVSIAALCAAQLAVSLGAIMTVSRLAGRYLPTNMSAVRQVLR
jgi:low temperature requirement protein LtrA